MVRESMGGERVSAGCEAETAAAVTAQISAGGRHSFFLGRDDELWACGSNDEGQLALEQSAQSAEQSVQSMPSVALPARVPGLPCLPLRFAVAAGDHSIAVVEECGLHNGGTARGKPGIFLDSLNAEF